MEPISALILLGVLTAASARTVSSGVTDVVAQAKGRTPPSLEKWRHNQKRKEARGEQPASEEPSPWKRRWHNAAEKHNAKAAQKHQADMEYLRDHGHENVAKRKKKLERRGNRRDAVNTRVAGWSSSSWDAIKQSTEAARERAAEREAWRENARRDNADDVGSSNSDADAAAGPDATVLPFQRPSSETEQPLDDETAARRRYDPDEITARWRDAISRGETTTNVLTVEQWNSLPQDTRDQLIAETIAAGHSPMLHSLDGTSTRLAPSNNKKKDVLSQTDSEHELVGDPDSPTRQVSVAELRRRRDAEERERQRAYEAAEAQAHREHAERMAQIQQSSTTNTGGTEDMNNTATEITDLDTAMSFSQETARYADTVGATLSDMTPQIEAAAKGLEAEAAQYEQGKASLEGEGFKSKVTGRFDTAADALHAAAQALRTAAQTVTEASEQVGTAGGEMRGAAKVFGDQQAVAEQIGAAAQDGGVSKRTDFYAPA